MKIREELNKFIHIAILLSVAICVLLLFKIPAYGADYTQKTITVSDGRSPLNGRQMRLYYDLDGNLIQDTESIIGAKSKYEIFVNKVTNVVTIYNVDGGVYVPVKRFVCSNGGGNTPEGNFYTPNKYRWHELMGPCYGQWDTRITGGVLFHSVYYNSYNNNNTLNVAAYNKLGTTCSHGCVRLRAGDAKWIYDNCPLRTRVCIYSSTGFEPFTKPKADVLPAWHTWDPTDPNMHYRCEQHGCHGQCSYGVAYDNISGQSRYYRAGVFADWITGLVNGGNSWVYVKNGVVDYSANGLVKNKNGWWLVKNGVIDFSANTLARNEQGWWYVNGGQIKFGFNGIARNEQGDWAVQNGKVNFGYNGLLYADNIRQNYNGQTITYNGWYYFQNGKLSTGNGIAKAGDKYVYVNHGKIDYSYTGVADNKNGTWFLRNGVVGFDLNGIVSDGKNYYYVVKSQVMTNCNGFVNVNGQEYYMNRGRVVTENTLVKIGNEWVLISGGKPDYNYWGVAKNNVGYWFVRAGKVDFTYTGLLRDNANNVWYVDKGKIYTGAAGEYDLNCPLIVAGTHEQSNVSGRYFFNNGKIDIAKIDIVNYKGTWVYEKYGQIDWAANTVAQNANGWWYIKNGKVDFSFNGIGTNENGQWHIKNGKVSFSTNGLVRVGDDWYLFKNGKLQTGEPSLVYYNDSWWYVNGDGKIDFSYTGLATNNIATWYVQNGKITFDYNGDYENEGIIYKIVNSKVVA